MGFRHGVHAEVLLSLALLMVAATGLLTVTFLKTSQARIDGLHELLARGFFESTRTARFEIQPIEGGLWWRLDESGEARGLAGVPTPPDAATLALAREALERRGPLVRSGAPWAPLRFAAPQARGQGAIAGRIDAPLSGVVLAGIVLFDVVIFGLFGYRLLRGRVVGPLRRLAMAVREIGEGDLEARAPVEGVGEIAALGQAFNEMQESLAQRTRALEKAVEELRRTNASLVQAREGLDRAERLAMVGSLAAGVAHEVGNPMGALLAFLDGVARDPGLGEKGRHCVDRAREQGERVRTILRQLLDFSRPPSVEHVPIALDDVARQAVELVVAQPAYRDIDFEVVAEEMAAPRALGDAGLVSQILLNLVLNAAAALEGAERRAIRLEVGSAAYRQRAGDERERAHARSSRDAVACWVEDSGPGVSEGLRERVFDPFFTTKAPGEGTGLGLANARRLAEEMQGRIELDREPSDLGGARFRFVLPAASDEAGAAPPDVRTRSGDPA